MRGERMCKLRGGIQSIRARRASIESPGPGWMRDPNTGLWLKKHFNKNIVVLAGLTAMFSWIQYGHADQGGSIRYMGVGTGSTTPSKSDTALVAEDTRVEIASWDNTNLSSDPVVMIATYLFDTTEANAALMECALFKASSGAPMFCRGLFGYGTISGATKANPCVITAVGHGLSSEDKIYIENVAGMTELNDNAYWVSVLTADTFALYSDATLATSVDSSAYGTYSTASPDQDTWKLIIPKTSAETLTVNYSLTHPAD